MVITLVEVHMRTVAGTLVYLFSQNDPQWFSDHMRVGSFAAFEPNRLGGQTVTSHVVLLMSPEETGFAGTKIVIQ